MNYWQKRILKEQEKAYDKSLLDMQKALKKIYLTASKSIQSDMSDLYDKLAKDGLNDGTVHINDYYKFNRNFELMQKINKQLTNLGESEIKIDTAGMIDIYNTAQNIIKKDFPNKFVNKSFTLANKYSIDELVKMSWAKDDMTLSKRIWKNKALIQNNLEQGLTECIVQGKQKDKLVEKIMETMNTSFNDSDRIVRTELSHYLNKGSVDKYKDCGVRQVKTIVENDERLCELCEEHENEIHDIDFATDGVAYNYHPNCRCTTVPLIN